MDDPKWLLAYPGARGALNRLVEATYPRTDREGVRKGLLELLEWLRMTDRKAGAARRGLKTSKREPLFKGQLAAACETLKEFARSIAAMRDNTPAVFFLPPPEPLNDALHHWAGALVDLKALSGHQPLHDILIALLVSQVKKRTGAVHDQEVSTLLTAARGTDQSPDTLRVWRLRKKVLIRQVKEIQEMKMRTLRVAAGL